MILFRELIDHSSDYLSIIDLQTGQYLYVNEAACNAIGYTRDEFRTMSVSDIDPSITRPWDEERERKKRGRKSIFIREGLIRRKDGTSFPVEVSSSIISQPGGDYMVATARDISERKHTEKLLRDSCDELERRVKERTAELLNINEALRREIAQRTRAEKTIRASERTLKRQKSLLARKNIALGEMVKQIGWEKHQVMNNVIVNVEELLLPLLNKMQLAGASRKYIAIIRQTIRKIASGFGVAISRPSRQMTSREIEISNMILSGLSCKEISKLLLISHRSAEWHSHNIRKKLGIVGKKASLKGVLRRL